MPIAEDFQSYDVPRVGKLVALQNGRTSWNEAKKKTVPSKNTTAELRTLALRATKLPHRLSAPAKTIARLREPTDIAASADTVKAVPNAIANVARMPAQIIPCVAAKMMTSNAPVHGRMPIENAMASARLHDRSPFNSSGPGR